MHQKTGSGQQFLSETIKKHVRLRTKAVAIGMSASSSWKGELIKQSLSSEDIDIRRMAIKELENANLPDDYFASLLSSPYEDVTSYALTLLARRGSSIIQKYLPRILREAPPSKNWTWNWSKRWQAWRDRKVQALSAAGQSHDSLF